MGRIRFGTAPRLVMLLWASALAFMTGCSTDSDGIPIIVTADQLAAAEQRFEAIDREAQLYADLVAGDFDRGSVAAFVETAYAPGIVFEDVSFGQRDEGREQVAEMYNTFLFYFADADVSWRSPLVGAETAVSVITFSDVRLGGTEFTADNPLIEVDVTGVSGDQVASHILFYDRRALDRLFPAADLPGDPEGYVDAWNSGDDGRVVKLYAENATRVEGVDTAVVDGESFAEQLDRFATALDGATWTLDLAFAQAGGERSGVLVTVTSDDCAAELALVWDHDESDLITNEIVHYDPTPVSICRWVG